MKSTLFRIFGMLIMASLVLSACAPKAAPTAVDALLPASSQPYQLTGTYTVTNDFVLTTYYVENAVALIDMHGFVLRDLEWEIPVDSQTLGFMTFDADALGGTYELSLPARPLGEFNDVDNDGSADAGVQIFSVAYSPNVYGGPFAEGDDRSRGWPSYLASVKTDSENKDEVIGGKLVVWAEDADQQFPTGFGEDGLLFTADDPIGAIPEGYSIVDLDQSPFSVSQDQIEDLTLYEPQDIAVKDYSAMSYTESFNRMFETIRKEYAFADIEGEAPDWDALYAELKPRVEQAEKDGDPNAFYLALRDFTWAFNDGHVSISGGDYFQRDFATAISGGYGFAIRELDDGRVIVIFVVEGGPAQAAGIQVGAEVTEFNGQPIGDAISAAQTYSNQSSDFAIRYQKSRYLLRALPGTEASVKFANADGIPQLVNLVAIEERQSFSRTSLYFGVDTSSLLPVDSKIIPVNNENVGYIRINSNYDDLNLVIRLFERALKQFEANTVAGIVIDMRFNNGGAPLGLAGFFTDQEILLGQLEYYSDKTGKFEPEGLRQKFLPNQNQYRFEKMVLLVGPACFSACEIEAYGFSQVPGMIVVGLTPTSGVEAETARGTFNLPDGFSVTVPTGRFVLPDGTIFLEGQGVQPTLRIPVDEKTATAIEDIVLQAGIDAVLQPLGAGVTPSAAPKVASPSEAEAALSSGAPFLEDLARESYDPAVTFAQPGTATYSVSMTDPQPVVWGYSWCAADAAMIASNFENIELKFVLDGKNVPADSFATFEIETGGKVCRLVYTSLSEWTAGEHHLSTTAVFTSAINDGTSNFEPGDYIIEYTVYVKP
ncbi:MAG: PDZ domain-containing protein [Anaerolineales bacterium]|nr:PDZ domain-containing protein [Anaerolineales bacterium]